MAKLSLPGGQEFCRKSRRRRSRTLFKGYFLAWLCVVYLSRQFDSSVAEMKIISPKATKSDRADHCSPFAIYNSHHPFINPLRGGSSESNSTQYDDDDHDLSIDEESERNSPRITRNVQQSLPSNVTKRKIIAWLPGSFLFNLGSEVKAEALIVDAIVEDDKIGRGGALVKAKTARTRPRWHNFFDVTSSGSSLLLDQDDLTEPDDATWLGSFTNRIVRTVMDTAKNTVSVSSESFQRIWGVNTGDEQLTLNPNDEKPLLVTYDCSNNQTIVSFNAEDMDPSPEKHCSNDELEIQSKTELAELKKVNSAAKITENVSIEQPIVDEISLQATKQYPYSKKRRKSLNTEEGCDTEDDESSISANISIPLDISSNNVPITETTLKSPYVSSGYWNVIDRAFTAGLVENHPEWSLSARLRPVRKMIAHITGMHGILSGKPHFYDTVTQEVSDSDVGVVRKRLVAIDRFRRNAERLVMEVSQHQKRRFFWNNRRTPNFAEQLAFVVQQTAKDLIEEERRKNRVKSIDKQIKEAQHRLMQLACEKDVLQRRLNPLWNYTIDNARSTVQNKTESIGPMRSKRDFKFPPGDLVDDYLDMLFASGRLDRLNHTDLWRNENWIEDDDDDEDDFLSTFHQEEEKRRRNANNGAGSWLLRNGIGEKIGVTVETVAYKAVCSTVMSILAKLLSNLHGVNVLTYSDVRLSMEQAPELPPITAGMIPGSGPNRNYAHDAIQDAIRRGVRNKRYSERKTKDAFVQRDAVVETLASQCSIAAPLLSLFPIAWQRAIIGNVVVMTMAVITDFCEGIEFQILGHRLTLSFSPITEEDMIRGMLLDSYSNRQRANPEEFEAAVKATAAEVGENLKFLDRWHERAMGSGMLRTQIATLIARLVLSLLDDILRGSRMDLWASHAGGPRIRAGLEYRSS